MAGVGGMWFFGIAAAFYEMPVRVVPQGAQAPAVPVALSTTPRIVAPPLDQGSATGSAWVAPVAVLAVAAVATSARKKVRPGSQRVPAVKIYVDSNSKLELIFLIFSHFPENIF